MGDKALALAVIVSAFFLPSLALNCYQCSGNNSSVPFQCNEWLTSDIDIAPESCNAVYGAKYCIKHTGRFEGSSINCYQCASSENMECADAMVHMGGIQAHSCDHVFEAQYCIKSTSLDGICAGICSRGIGTKRYCSSLDLGNYCNYVKQPGDTLQYRSCVYTCTGDGCNPSVRKIPSLTLIILMDIAIMAIRFS